MNENTMPENGARVMQVGPDRVTISEHQVVIEARHPMSDWKVREFNPAPVYFQDRKYYLAEQRRGEGRYAARYLLLPWPEGQAGSSRIFHTYDAEAVAERDGACRSEHVHDLVYAFLLPVYPLLGLLWSGTQRRLGRFGAVPRTMSGLSIFAVFSLLFGQGVFAVITIQATVRTGKMLVGGLISALAPVSTLHLGGMTIPLAWFDVLLTLALLADLAVRYSLYLREDQWIGGFLEWLVRRAPEDEADESTSAGALRVDGGGQRSEGWEHHHRLGRLSFWLPAAVFLVCVAVYRTVNETGGSMKQPLIGSCGLVLAGALMAGVALSIAAFSGIRQHGSRGILGPALRGLVLCGIVFVLFAAGVVSGLRNAAMVAHARETTKEVTADIRRDLTNGTELANSLEARQAGLEKVRGALDNLSQNTSGQTAIIARVSSQHLAKIQTLMSAYAAAYKPLKQVPVVDMNGVTNRQQLATRKALVNNFLTANDNLQAFLARLSDSYRADLQAAGVAPESVAAALSSYEKSAGPQKPVLMRIREDDRTIGKSMLAMLDILDRNWGKWTYNPVRKKVEFEDMPTLDRFLDYRDAVKAAAEDQQKEQVKMASLLK